LQAATDAAALAGGGVGALEEAACTQRARQVLNGRLAEKKLPSDLEPNIVCHANGVSVTAGARMPTSLLGIVGIQSLDLGSSSEVTCGVVSEAGSSSQPIAWRQTHLPDMTRVVTLGTTISGTVYYWQTPEGRPIVRIDNPADEPSTIVLRSTPAGPDGDFSFHLPNRGQFFVIIPWTPPPGNLVFRVHAGPEPRSGGTSTWSNTNYRTMTTIPGTPVYATEEARRCWISG
jgi:hypothetical protein